MTGQRCITVADLQDLSSKAGHTLKLCWVDSQEKNSNRTWISAVLGVSIAKYALPSLLLVLLTSLIVLGKQVAVHGRHSHVYRHRLLLSLWQCQSRVSEH